MRALVQRVTEASVSVGGELVGSIDVGLVVFLGISQNDTEIEAKYIVDKVSNLRIFYDEEGKFNYSPLDTGIEILIVSQFTLYADTRRGRRPSFTEAAKPEIAKGLFEYTVGLFKKTGLKIETGLFQEYMSVSLKNDGPVTIIIDSKRSIN